MVLPFVGAPLAAPSLLAAIVILSEAKHVVCAPDGSAENLSSQKCPRKERFFGPQNGPQNDAGFLRWGFCFRFSLRVIVRPAVFSPQLNSIASRSQASYLAYFDTRKYREA